MLALIIPLTLTAIIQGFALSKIGIVPFFWIFGGALATIGSGLLYSMDANTSTGKWIGYQILVGFATGNTFQVAIANAQVHARPEDLSQVSAIINCKSTFSDTCYTVSYLSQSSLPLVVLSSFQPYNAHSITKSSNNS
jgi:hypothetical protein